MDIFIFASEQWLLLSTFLVLLYLFIFTERTKGGKPISSTELVSAMNAETAILIDVRPSNEFQAGHIHGAIDIPHTKIASRISELEKYRERTIVLVDQMGQHAGSAGKILSKDGFNVRRLSGGMNDWQHQNMPVVKN
ncbi:MAG: rhodanese-like domain-containing protein [Porticoccaceae bacterium]|nr:rhodanese-like domain-containing protein [Porticoccaceae bacterium]MDG1475017.1 rhodanese-like domain-containing protein [Porticoccaceae bacterium]